MEIKIITCHDVYNYGASLQAYALQSFLSDRGHDVKIIDYKPDYISFPYKFSMFVHPDSPVKKYTDKSKLLLYIYAIKRFFWYLPTLERKRTFNRFTNSYLTLTHKYGNIKELFNDIPNADCYIVGSDQVWNSITMLNGKDPAFYLQFVPSDKKKISYAASFGANSISEDNKSNICQWLSYLNAISVREKSGVDVLRSLGIQSTHVCDPVFLLNENEWRNKLNIKKTFDRYVLIYNLTTVNKCLIEDAVHVAKHFGLKIYSVSPISIKYADRSFKNVGPREFIELIFNAEYVFTNSFHATAFSIISKREFCTYNYHSKSNSSRMFSVLKEFDLLERLNNTGIQQVIDNPISYHRKWANIESSCLNGKKWLLSNI